MEEVPLAFTAVLSLKECGTPKIFSMHLWRASCGVPSRFIARVRCNNFHWDSSIAFLGHTPLGGDVLSFLVAGLDLPTFCVGSLNFVVLLSFSSLLYQKVSMSWSCGSYQLSLLTASPLCSPLGCREQWGFPAIDSQALGTCPSKLLAALVLSYWH